MFSGTRSFANPICRVFSVACVVAAICLYLPTSSHAQLWSGIIDQSRATDWSQAGIPAGIPTRTTLCATLNSGATAAQINSAIAACPSGQVVFLNAGTYNLSGAITIARSNVTLRGAGPDQTKLVFSSGSGCGNTTSVVCVRGSGQWSGAPDNLTAWTANYAQGTTVITLGSVANLSVGQVLILDQLDDASDPGNIYVCGTLACSSEGQASGGGRGGNHAQMQFAEVKAINTATRQVTISPGLYMPNWRASQSPSAWWANTLAQNVGIENLLLDNRTAGAGSITVFFNAYKSWMKNIASIGGGARSHVDMQWSSNLVVRDSYFWGSAGASLSYGIETWMSGNALVENNIFQHVTGSLLVGAGEGSVWSYNYATDIYSTNPSWLYPSGSEHDPGTSMNLYEGNILPSLMEDTVHGTHNLGTYFRNRLTGVDGAHTLQTVPFLLQSYSRYANFLGNVLGTAGYHNNYQAIYGGSATNCDKSIYNLGWGGTQCGTGVGNDALTVNTLMRWGNYDTVTGAARWNASEVPSGLSLYGNAVPANQNLPASFYLSSKPSFWGARPWPPIGPDVSGGDIAGVGGHAYLIPAQLCYNTTSKDANGILIFNANICYTIALDTAPPTVSMTTPANGAAVAGSAVTVSATAADNVGVVGVQFKLDGVNLGAEDTTNAYSISWNSSVAADGPHTLTAVARDAAGNTATAVAVGVTVDNTPPVISAVSAASITAVGALITWATNEASNSQVDYGLTSAYGSSMPLNSSLLTAHAETLTGFLANTTYHYRVKSRDAAGNLATSADFAFTTLVGSVADLTPPVVSMTAPASGATVSGTIMVSASATDNVGVAGVQFKLDGANLGAELTTAPYTLSWNTTTASNAAHTLTAVARDTVGNTATSAAISVTVDNSPPTVSVSSPAPGTTVSGTILVSNAHSDNLAVVGVQFKLDGVNLGAEVTAAPYAISWDTTLVANGPHTLTAVARDAAGNTATSTAVSVTVANGTGLLGYWAFDEGTGTTAIDSSGSGNNGVLFNSPAFIAGRMGNALSFNGVNQYVQVSSTSGLNLSNAITLAAWINPSDVTAYRTIVVKGAAGLRGYGMNLINGNLNFIKVNGTDVASSVAISAGVWQHVAITWNAVTGEVKFYKDGALAQTVIDGFVPSTSLDTDNLLVGLWLGGGSYFAGAMDELRVYSSALSAADILALYAIPTADTTPPTIAITAPTTASTYSTSSSPLTLGGTASDNVGVTQVTWANSRGGSGTASGTTSWTASGIALQLGTNVLTVTAQDAAGNTATASVTVTGVDALAPTIAITAPTTASTYSTSSSPLTLGGTASDNVGVTQVTWANSRGGSGTASGTTSWTASGIALQLGTNVLTVTAQDAAGNTATASLTVTGVDAMQPTVSMTAPAAGGTVAGTITVSASASDNVGIVGVQFKLDGANLGAELTTAPYSISWNTTTTTSGAHNLSAVARDAAGSVTTSSVVSVTVSNPIVSITAPLNGATLTNLTKVSVQAANGKGLSSIQVYGDGILIDTVSCIGNSCSGTVNWHTIGLAAGPHSLYAVATDTFGITSSTTPITVFK